MDGAKTIVNLANAELGYLEKSRNAWNKYGINCLYTKEQFAGSDNVTKYAYETGHYNSYGWAAWCMTFVVWLMMASFGKDKANQLLCGMYSSASTMDTKNAMIKAGRQVSLSEAQPGDIVFRSRSGGGHVGVVIGWSNGKIVTIEGNTSSTDITSWNGGAVASHTGATWQWCCRPNWALVDTGWHWVKADGKWYYQDASGRNSYGWKTIQETGGTVKHWYYFDAKGAMLTGAQFVGDKLCCFMPSGSLEGALCKSDESGYQHIWNI